MTSISRISFAGLYLTPGTWDESAWNYNAVLELQAMVSDGEAERPATPLELEIIAAAGIELRCATVLQLAGTAATEPPVTAIGQAVMVWLGSVLGALQQHYTGSVFVFGLEPPAAPTVT